MKEDQPRRTLLEQFGQDFSGDIQACAIIAGAIVAGVLIITTTIAGYNISSEWADAYARRARYDVFAGNSEAYAAFIAERDAARANILRDLINDPENHRGPAEIEQICNAAFTD